MRYLSLFSGIEAASVAWRPLGWECVAVAEIEPFPCAVLAHRFPTVPNLGDITQVTEEQIQALGPIDLVVFGSPCQDLSVAGKRAGLSGERSGLFHDAVRIVRWSGARWALWENVVGALSSNAGRDFSDVLAALAGLDDCDTPPNGWGTEGACAGPQGLVEWAVLDAQWFGVAQRRRRVFALLDAGDWAHRRAVLLEPESERRVPSQVGAQDAPAAGLGDETRCLDCGVIWEPDGGLECCPMCGAMQSWAAPICGTLSDGAHMGGGLNGQDASSGRLLVHAGLPRRITPREAERLMGFPDDWTGIPYRGKEAGDGPRFRALGNSMAVPVMRWIGERIQLMERINMEDKA